jgi:4-hydroxy-2-oxoglutarate aldolase
MQTRLRASGFVSRGTVLILNRGEYFMNLSGVFPALTTPFDIDGAVSTANLKQNIAIYNTTEVAGYVALGSTGESVLLSTKEREIVLSTIREAANPQKRLIAGTGAESTALTIEWTKQAAALGYQAALVKTPFYYKPSYSTDILISHYQRVADASPIPIILYSVPIFTGVALEAPEVAVLANHANIIGIKESSGNVHRVNEIIAAAPPHFQVSVGSAATLLPSLTVGACGAILALACPFPGHCVQLFDLVQKNEQNLARDLQNILLYASNLVVSRAGIAGVKFAMDKVGYCGGLPRLPLVACSEEIKQQIRSMMSSLENRLTSARGTHPN